MQEASQMHRNDDWRGQYGDDQRFGGVSYGRGDQMDPNRMWQGDNPRDRDYGMVGSWHERRDDWRNEGFDDASRYGNARRWDTDDRFGDDRGRNFGQGGNQRFDHRDRTVETGDRWGPNAPWDRNQGEHYQSQGQFRGQGQFQGQQGRGPHVGKGPKGYQRNFERVKENVCDALEQDGFVDASNIEVRCENGEIVLTGTVLDRQQKRRAELLAERVDGVRDVHNQLRVQGDQQQGRNDTTVPNLSNTQGSGRAAST
jgi:osmotically-inducible protein OsmY